MAKYTAQIHGNLEHFMDYLEGEILGGSHSATLEDQQTMQLGDVKCMVQVYERYSYFGGNRVSLNVTAFGRAGGDSFAVTAITAGGSQAVFFKINTVGEENFLDKFVDAVNAYSAHD